MPQNSLTLPVVYRSSQRCSCLKPYWTVWGGWKPLTSRCICQKNRPPTRLLIPDLVSLTSLKEDSTDDQSFNETWAAGDYRLEPYNAEPEQHWGEPHTSIRVRQHGAKTTFSSGEQRFQIAGVWGYRQYKEDSGTDLNDAAMTATKITVPVDDGTQFAIGQTIMIGSEQMLITDISTNDLTVTRG